MRFITVATDGYEAAANALRRTSLHDSPEMEAVVRGIIADVRNRGDEALLELSRRFDSPDVSSVETEAAAWKDAEAKTPGNLQRAIRAAYDRIVSFHEKQRKTSWTDVQPGRVTGQIVRPLERVGIYVPGGTAIYPSSVLMTAGPARAAGVEEIVLCTPAQRDGRPAPSVLFAASVAGIERVFCVGGAQAVAAMAYGTETVPRVDKVVGPGNSYVNIAKRLLWGVVDIDMLAGPSEVCVVADETANPVFAALDLLTQAEHDVECAAYLITCDAELARRVVVEIDRQLATQSRAGVLREALERNGAIIVTESVEQACELANVCAPEHLALMVRDPFASLGRIKNAGAVLLGDYTPQTLGDYAAGPSHTLPTSGTARFASPLHVDTFLKKSSFIYYDREALNESAEILTTLARAEGFMAHADAVDARTGWSG